jgi:CRP-like cAMP-binding protein
MVHVHSGEPLRNRLLARLDSSDFARLSPHLQLVPLQYDQAIYNERGPMEYAYFPISGVISAVTTMDDGTAIEVATIGNEGMAGLPSLIETESSPNRLFVQVAGNAFRMPADLLRREAQNGSSVKRALQLYQNAFLVQVSQSVACNGLHTVQQRCCRWLLITQDRVQETILPLTHELLSIMLGVRRQSVTEVLQNIQDMGHIQYRRGKIEVTSRKGLEIASCECYQKVKSEYERLLGL